MASYTAGDVVVGTTWPLQVQLLQGDDPPVPVEGVKPDEGTTGWSDTWMLAKDAAHPNCMKLWMNHMMSPEANAQATVWFGEAATSPQACEAAEALSPGHCEAQHADDESLLGEHLLLEHATGGLRRRRRSHDVQDPGRLGPGLDHASRQLSRWLEQESQGSPAQAGEPFD